MMEKIVMPKYLKFTLNFGVLNREQSKILANFFMDIAKALLLGAIGFSVTEQLLIFRLSIGMFNVFAAVFFVKLALWLLNDVK